ncbi:MAG: threonine/serine exporter family protein [Muribaculaceae bacterium]|nr:threonine/serine exporter family protein [Muribaculaceae bacterium]
MKMQNSSTISEKCAFLADYASWLWGCGATCARITKNTARIARALGIDCELTVMPSHVELSLAGADGADAAVYTRRTGHSGISFDINARLSRLSWEIADGLVDFPEAVRRFDEIKRTRPTGQWEVLLLVGPANAAFCRLFGGDWAAMLTVLVATLAGYPLKQTMIADGRDLRLTFLCAAFFSAAISAGAWIFGWGDTPDIALATSVLYLIPGVPYINAVSDLMAKHYLCAFSRFMDACVLTACLSAGLCAGMFILGLEKF